jgi:hypothetical protein
MDRRLLVFVAIGLGVVGLAIAALLFFTQGEVIQIRGSIQHVRWMAQADGTTLAVVDFRFHNPSNYEFRVDNVKMIVTKPHGQTVEGMTVAENDARRIFDYYPTLGQKFNQTLIPQTRINPKESLDRMLAARLEMSAEDFENRNQLVIRVQDVDGPVSELREKEGRSR